VATIGERMRWVCVICVCLCWYCSQLRCYCPPLPPLHSDSRDSNSRSWEGTAECSSFPHETFDTYDDAYKPFDIQSYSFLYQTCKSTIVLHNYDGNDGDDSNDYDDYDAGGEIRQRLLFLTLTLSAPINIAKKIHPSSRSFLQLAIRFAHRRW